MKNIESKGITLIALVITIIILLILAGISISALTERGLFENAKLAKEKNEFASACETLNLKIMEANTNNIETKGKMCNLRELEEYLGKNEETQINVINYNKIATRKEDIGEIPLELKNIEVKVVKYPRYSFIIGEQCKIEKYSIDGNEYINIGENQSKVEEDETSAKNTKIYYKNDDCSEITGGWDVFINNELKTSTLENNNYLSTYGEYNITTEELQTSIIPVSYGRTGSSIEFKTKNKIDITSYDKIGVLVATEDVTDFSSIGITDNSEYNYVSDKITDKESIKNNEPTYFDISDFIGEYHIQIGFGSYLNGKCKIKEIWLERDQKEILELYKRGNEYTNIGGELINNPIIAEYNKATLKKNSDNILFEVNATYSTNPLLSKTNLLDITNYDKLRVEIEIVSKTENRWRNINIGVYDSGGNTIDYKRISGPEWGINDNIGMHKNVTLNIKDISNTQTYPGITANGYTFKFYRMWLEKKIEV